MNHEKKKMRIWKKALFIFLAVFSILIVMAYGVFRYYYSLLSYYSYELAEEEVLIPEEETEDVTDIFDQEGEELSEEDPLQIETSLQQNLERVEVDSELYTTDTFNLLLIGVDTSGNTFSGRSDAMILISIDKFTKQITMASLLRDIYVVIPGYTSNRLNAAYAYGGTALLTETIEVNFGIHVDRCVVINFYSVVNAIDSIGGIEVELTSEEIGMINKNVKSQYKTLGIEYDGAYVPEGEGERYLNGVQALYYARLRRIGTDFARTSRQRIVLAACLEKVKQMSLGELNDLLIEFLPQVRTNLTESDFAALLLMALDVSDYHMQTMTIPLDGTWTNTRIRGMAVLSIDFETNIKAWYELVNED